jgi:probable phosphoglycerate mutase
MPSTELIFIRHGETDWNREHRFQGGTDIDLNAHGHEQARRAALRLAKLPVVAVYCSDLSRARQTAEPIARALGLGVSVEPALRERSYGLFEGRTHDELVREAPQDYERWRAREPGFALPGGGESLHHVKTRVYAQMEVLARRHAGQLVAAVTHGGVLDAIYRIASGLAAEAPRTFGIPNAALNRVLWDGERFSVLHWADVEHLADLSPPTSPQTGLSPGR